MTRKLEFALTLMVVHSFLSAVPAHSQDQAGIIVRTINHQGNPLSEPVHIYLVGTSNEVLKLETGKDGLLKIGTLSCSEIHEIEVVPGFGGRVRPSNRQTCSGRITTFKIKT